MKIALFHYHLKPGGVTDVIIHSAWFLLANLKQIDEIRLVVGSEENTKNVLERIRQNLDRHDGNKLKLDVLPEIGYSNNDDHIDIEKMTNRLEARYPEDTLWWVHNYHIGKNPYFTAAVIKVAQKGQREIILHIHDFPECGRIDNFNKLNKVLNTPPYISGTRIRYAVINTRDKKILSDAGLEKSVYLLSNPVPPPPKGDASTEEIKSALQEKCASDNPGYLPNAPILLYPVRAIRRKNILEAGLIALLMEEPFNVITTLPGISAQERGYSNMVQQAYRDGLMPGIWCPEMCGDNRLSYANLVSGCNALISTSVMEGFGYIYVNALYWRKPLLARYIDVIDGILDVFGEYPRRFWADFRVPVDKEMAEKTKQAYIKKIDAIGDIIAPKLKKSLTSAVDKLVTSSLTMDFSMLSATDQLSLLRKAREDHAWTKSTKDLNHDLLESAGRTLHAKSPDMQRTMLMRFGQGIYTKNFIDIVSSFGKKTPSVNPDKIQQSVNKAFGRLDYMRLLYDSLDFRP